VTLALLIPLSQPRLPPISCGHGQQSIRAKPGKFLCWRAPENAEGLIIVLELAIVAAMIIAVMALLYRWPEPKT
jgi:hypothetical protein